jgi:hypothetical protein
MEPKTHKPGKKLRKITSNIDAPSKIFGNKATQHYYYIIIIIVAERLTYQFKQFPGPSGFYVENTQDAIKNYKTSKLKMMSAWFSSM